MVFFRLGKLGAADKAEKTDDNKLPVEGVGGATGSSSDPSASDPLTQDRQKHKKKKHSDDPETVAGAAIASAVGGLAAISGASGAGTMSSGSTAGRSQVAGLSVNDFISKTKNQQRQGLKPSGPELIAYARYLGIDPVADHDLLWIAVEALEAPLPSDWTEHFDSNDRVFYYNATMRVSSWTHPLEHIYRETYKTMVNFRNANMAAPERHDKLQTLQMEVKQMELDVHKEIAQWTEHTDEQGNRFYFNREERQSTWTDPRPAKCQILHLRMKMLRLLATSTGGVPSFLDGKGLGASGFAPLVSGMGEQDDPAFKRPKVGGAAGGSLGSGWAESGEVSEKRAEDDHSPVVSDSDSEDEAHKKKKKKKKKKKEKKRREAEKPQDGINDNTHAAAPPPGARGLGGQNLRSSQSEPTVGGKPLLGNVEEARGGLASMQSSSALSLAAFDHASEGLSTVGRQKIKAGIHLAPLCAGGLEPLSLRPTADAAAGERSADAAMHTPKGVRNCASMPALQP